MKNILITLFLFFTFHLFGQVQFLENAFQRGINHQYIGIPGGGVSFVDFDGDGWDDITLATEDGKPILFYKNLNGNFQQIPDFVGHTEESRQILWADFDNDGDKDLYVATKNGINRLYQNNGGFSFSDITDVAGLPMEEHNSFGAIWGDYDRDGWLDLYYSERKLPPGSEPNINRLFRNNADGTFTEKTAMAMAGDEDKAPFCSAFFDYNNDMWPDIYTANDKLSPNTLLENSRDGTFSDVGDTSHSSIVIDAMNVGIGDYDNDGWQDIYVTNLPYGNALLHNLGASSMGQQITFEEVAESSGVGFYNVSWGANFLDADNDGWLDLYVSGPYVGSDTTSSAFYHNSGNGTFEIPSNSGFTKDTVSSYNNAIGDINNDGYPDIMVINTPPFKSHLWRNSGGNNNWLKVKLEGVLSNKDAVGAKIEVYTANEYQMRFTHSGIGFMNQNSSTEIIGMKDHSVVDSIKVSWPTGHVDVLLDVDVNQTVFILEGSTTNGIIDVDPEVSLTMTSNENVFFTKKIDLKIFPNPSSSVINVELNDTSFSNYFIINSNGNVVGSGNLKNQNLISISHFPVGQYYFMITDSNGHRLVESFFVVR